MKQETASVATSEHRRVEPTDTLVALAPHGGEIEPYTAEQAVTCAEVHDNCAYWTFEATMAGGRAFDEFHVSSNEIDASNYHLLAELSEHRFEHAVSFHGFDSDRSDVYIGGQLDRSVREQLAIALREQTDLNVAVAVPNDGLFQSYGGSLSSNIVNRFAANGGVQIEQTMHARKAYGGRIAEIVAEEISSR